MSSTKRSRRRHDDAGAPRDERGLVGKVIGGKFHVRSMIGSGGVGNVYEAIDRTMRRTVAIKVPNRGASEVVIKRFLREGRAGAAIAHPNVCAFYDVGPLEDGVPFLVMERLFGETLADLLEREGRMSLYQMAIIMSQALSGLGAAHARGIVHRDMKPENIFVCRPAGGEQIVKVLDFGASKLDRFSVPREDDLEDLTATGFAVGTPYYMSPEQARGERELDGRVDIFACGIILYESLTGVRPFEGKNFQEVFAKIVAAEYVPARQLVPELPRVVDEILSHALARKREDRFPSAESFARAVEGLKILTPTPSEPPAPEEPSTERLAYLRQRFHELSVLYRSKGPPPKGDKRPPGGSSLDIPIFFDEAGTGTGTSPPPPMVEEPPPASSSPRTTRHKR